MSKVKFSSQLLLLAPATNQAQFSHLPLSCLGLVSLAFLFNLLPKAGVYPLQVDLQREPQGGIYGGSLETLPERSAYSDHAPMQPKAVRGAFVLAPRDVVTTSQAGGVKTSSRQAPGRLEAVR